MKLKLVRKHKKKVLFIITFVMLITIIITSYYTENSANVKATIVGDTLGYIVVPIQKYLNKFSKFVEDKLLFFQNVNNLINENKELTLKVEELETEINRLKLYEADNIKYSELLKLKDEYSQQFKMAAEVIGKETSNWYEIFTIDKGRKDEISSNMVVLTQWGLVGRITETSLKYSKVMAIIDDRSSVSAKNLRTNDLGIVKGDSGLCRMDFIDIEAEIIVGDEIVTSHLSETYPSGITIGHIKEIKLKPDGLTKYALIEPVVDFKHIETVLIINGKENYFDDVEE